MHALRSLFTTRSVTIAGAVAAATLAGSLHASIGVSAQQANAPTFNQDVGAIIYDKCASCHRPGAVGAMPLTSYKEVRPWARSIKTRVTRREMPPWSADPRFGDYLNDISLSPQQIDLIAKWVDSGSPEGAAPAPKMPEYVDGGWRTINGRGPDVVLEMPMEYELPAEGQIPVFRIWDKNPFKEDVYVQALQIRPSNPAVTHHSALYGRELPEGATLKENFGWKNGPTLKYIPTFDDGSIVNILTGGGGGSIEGVEGKADVRPGDRVPVVNRQQQTEEDDERLMFYLPGSDFQVFPEGSAKRIRASNALMWEVHYSPSGVVTTDRERIGLWLAKNPDQREVHVIRNGSGQHIIENAEVGSTVNLPAIPAHAGDWKITAIQPFTEDATLASMQPHMHLRGKDMTYVATYPDGREEILLSVPKYDFNWQNTYMPRQAVKLPAGTVLKTVGHYDNSVANRMNPQPYRPALWSEQTWDEMYNAWTEITYDHELTALRTGAEARARQQAAARNNPITTVVGCAVPGADILRWTLTNGTRLAPPAQAAGTAPARVGHNITRDERDAAARTATGSETFELIGVSDFVSNERSLQNPIRKSLYPLERVNATGALEPGRRVAAKGVWIPGSPARLNLTSVTVLDQRCGAAGSTAAGND
jgi:mono/diheme cytochrome c family protein